MANNKLPESFKEVNRSLNKHGEIKGESKKKTKILKGKCFHSSFKKNGKRKKRFYIGHDEMCHCEMCKGEFLPRPLSKDELREAIDVMRRVNNQVKYLSMECNADIKTMEFFANFGSMLEIYEKPARRLQEIARKEDSVKKNKKRQSYDGSQSYGSWNKKR